MTEKKERYFGIRIAIEEFQLLQELADINGRSTSGEVRRAIKEYIENNKHLIKE